MEDYWSNWQRNMWSICGKVGGVLWNFPESWASTADDQASFSYKKGVEYEHGRVKLEQFLFCNRF